MRKIFIILFILFSSSSLLAGTQSQKTEYELKLPLTEIGYHKFKKLFIDQFQALESKRSDLYFDIFENHHFILKNLSDPIKLRFQDSKWQIQKSHALKGLGPLTAKKSESFSIDIDPSVSSQIHDESIIFQHELINSDPLALNSAIRINQQLRELKLTENATQLCSQCTKDKIYYSSQINEKTRYKIKLKEKGLEFIIFVGATISELNETYELEAEVKNNNDDNSDYALKILSNWLNNQGLMAEDILLIAPIDQRTQAIEKKLDLLI